MPINHQALQGKRSRSGTGWRPKVGDNKIRILPPSQEYFTSDIDYIAASYVTHWFNLEGRTEVSLCPDFGRGTKECPACRAYWKYRNSEDPGLKEIIRRISPSERYVFNILDLTNPSGGIQRWETSWTVWDKIMEIASNPEWGDVLDPAKGINFNLHYVSKDRSRTGFPVYSPTPLPDRVDIIPILNGIEGWKEELDGEEIRPRRPRAFRRSRVCSGNSGFLGIQ